MARPGLLDHPKFRRLVYVLGEPIPHVLGYLECMWQVGYASGNPVLGDKIDVELAAQYPSNPDTKGRLQKALLDCRFIDALPDGRFQIHDLFENAPGYVKCRGQHDEERKKVKKCDRCGVEFHSPETRAKFCTSACRQAAYRDRAGDGVTERDGAVRNGDGPARNSDAALRTSQPSPAQPFLGEESPKNPSCPEPAPKRGRRKKRPGADPELTAAARRVVENYQATVRPKHPKDGGVNNVTALLADGMTEERLCACANAYAAACRDTPADFRMKVRNFYGLAGGYKDYLDQQPVQQATHEEVAEGVRLHRERAAREKAEAAGTFSELGGSHGD